MIIDNTPNAVPTIPQTRPATARPPNLPFFFFDSAANTIATTPSMIAIYGLQQHPIKTESIPVTSETIENALDSVG